MRRIVFHFIGFPLISILFSSGQIFGQNVAITDDEGHTADPTAMLDVKSASKGMLVPRLTTTQRNGITDPAPGLLVFDSTVGSFFYYFGGQWTNLSTGDIWDKSGSSVFLTDPDDRLGVGTNQPFGKLEVKGDVSIGLDEPIFEVINADGDTVFAVYPEGVRIVVSDGDAKGAKGGFAIGGISALGKGEVVDYLRVTPDSVRIYVDTSASKGAKGGFAIGGISSLSKGPGEEYFRVTPDSVRVYIADSSSAKGAKGGFAIGGITKSSKGGSPHYLNVSGQSQAEIIDPSDSRILWYPYKEAFLTGRVLIESADSVGTNSLATGFESKAIGNWSQALGYRSIARGSYATAIGNNAVANESSSFAFGNEALALGENSYSFGQWAQADNTESYAFGRGAIAEGFRSFAFGSAGIDSAGATTGVSHAIGDYSFAIGQGSVASGFGSFTVGLAGEATGNYSTAIGYKALAGGLGSTAMGFDSEASSSLATAMGYNTTASGVASTALGRETTASGGASTATGYLTEAIGAYSTAMGHRTKANGDYSTAMGDSTTASDYYSTAMGDNTTASGRSSTAMGYKTVASGGQSTAMGYESTAKGYYSTAIGYGTTAAANYSTTMGRGSIARGTYSTAIGYGTTASGSATTAMGYGTTARAYASTVIGRYNDSLGATSQFAWVLTEPLFIIGKGFSETIRSNAVVVLKNGEVYFPDVYADAVGGTNKDLFIDNTGKIGYVSSSRRYKKKISTLEDIGWLYQLRPVNFTYRNDKTDKKQYGLIAEEVEKVNPSFVSSNQEGQAETVHYSKLITPVIKALQDHENKIHAQQILIEDQQSRIDQLEKMVARLHEVIESGASDP
jgi:hypothetical protein